ncbi:hypothetical protein Lgra_2651 [Legionella gratiana]|uniref:Uncharacterized protein n=1 Tax=Legionella gratiana TaxID=45066 RepID=A0A378J3F1_9GAMM|nr:hypothetical protein [Legionella gratiana]KTD05874.1 hypothetical protein Lgra_2651 [Legionella gratiana]STX42294.1 Uncharacterised protein [Legionella gratiana]
MKKKIETKLKKALFFKEYSHLLKRLVQISEEDLKNDQLPEPLKHAYAYLARREIGANASYMSYGLFRSIDPVDHKGGVYSREGCLAKTITIGKKKFKVVPIDEYDLKEIEQFLDLKKIKHIDPKSNYEENDKGYYYKSDLHYDNFVHFEKKILCDLLGEGNKNAPFIGLAYINNTPVFIMNDEFDKKNNMFGQYTGFTMLASNASKFFFNLARCYNSPKDFIDKELNLNFNALYADESSSKNFEDDPYEKIKQLKENPSIVALLKYTTDYRGLIANKWLNTIKLLENNIDKELFDKNKKVILQLINLLEKEITKAFEHSKEDPVRFEYFFENASQLLYHLFQFTNKDALYHDYLQELKKITCPQGDVDFALKNSCMNAILSATYYAHEQFQKINECKLNDPIMLAEYQQVIDGELDKIQQKIKTLELSYPSESLDSQKEYSTLTETKNCILKNKEKWITEELETLRKIAGGGSPDVDFYSYDENDDDIITSLKEITKEHSNKFLITYEFDNSFYFEVRQAELSAWKNSDKNHIIYVAPVSEYYQDVDVIKQIIYKLTDGYDKEEIPPTQKFYVVVDETLKKDPGIVQKIFDEFPEQCIGVSIVNSYNKSTMYKRAPAGFVMHCKKAVSEKLKHEDVIHQQDFYLSTLIDHYVELKSGYEFEKRLKENQSLVKFFLTNPKQPNSQLEDYPLFLRSRLLHDPEDLPIKKEINRYKIRDSFNFLYPSSASFNNVKMNDGTKLYDRRASMGAIRSGQCLHQLAHFYFRGKKRGELYPAIQEAVNNILNQKEVNLTDAKIVLLAIVRGLELGVKEEDIPKLNQQLKTSLEQFPEDVKKHINFVLTGVDERDKDSKLYRFFHHNKVHSELEAKEQQERPGAPN